MDFPQQLQACVEQANEAQMDLPEITTGFLKKPGAQIIKTKFQFKIVFAESRGNMQDTTAIFDTHKISCPNLI